ncbi:baseplate J/gp47 family protein [Desulfocastanea catecholica]
MSCKCDKTEFPHLLNIAAGLRRLPRSLGIFADWRHPILDAIGRDPVLDDWRAKVLGQTKQDLGLMLVDMGAYVFDVVSFYDQLICHESYLRTAQLTGAQRRMVDLLGFLPRPALASKAWLAAHADGKKVVSLPTGNAFRSGEFDGNAPQIFELSSATAIDPRLNLFTIDRIVATQWPASFSEFLAEPSSIRVQTGDWVVFDFASALTPVRIISFKKYRLRALPAARLVGLSTTVTPPSGQTYVNTRVLGGGARAGAWKLGTASGETAVVSGNTVLIDTRVAIRANDVVLFEYGNETAACRVSSVSEEKRQLLYPQTSSIEDSAHQVSTLTSPAIYVTVSRLTLDSALPWSSPNTNQLTVHYALTTAAKIVAPPKDTLLQTDTISLPALIDAPRVTPENFLLQDVHEEGVSNTGTLDALKRTVTLDTTTPWEQQLTVPVQLFGNVLHVTRGQTVQGEVLGLGDASQAWQYFHLKKKPLTYLSASNAAGRVTTLRIHVDGVQWSEVETFYGVASDATVYTVRHDDEGQSTITFGGGARVPSGARVIANYRFGAGSAVPPAGSIQQIAKPLAGLRSVRQILPAFGGSDAESAQELEVYGPRSALLLGRAISLADLVAAARQVSGVKAASSSWRWDAAGLRPAAVITYIGDAQLQPDLMAKLRSLCEPDAPITLERSTPQYAKLSINAAIDNRYDPDQVVGEVQDVLFAKVTLPGSGGLLRTENLGPGEAVFQSTIVAGIMSVDGIQTVQSLLFNNQTFTQTGIAPNLGCHFDFSLGGVWINGQAAA